MINWGKGLHGKSVIKGLKGEVIALRERTSLEYQSRVSESLRWWRFGSWVSGFAGGAASQALMSLNFRGV